MSVHPDDPATPPRDPSTGPRAEPSDGSARLSARSDRALRRVSTAAVVVLAAAAAVLSYAGLRDLALAAGIHPALTWLLPVVIDGLTLVGSLGVVHAALSGVRAWYPWTLTLLGVAASVVGNIASSPHDVLSRSVHAAPPVVLALSLEALLRVYRHRALTRPGPAPLTSRTQGPGPLARPASLDYRPPREVEAPATVEQRTQPSPTACHESDSSAGVGVPSGPAGSVEVGVVAATTPATATARRVPSPRSAPPVSPSAGPLAPAPPGLATVAEEPTAAAAPTDTTVTTLSSAPASVVTERVVDTDDAAGAPTRATAAPTASAEATAEVTEGRAHPRTATAPLVSDRSASASASIEGVAPATPQRPAQDRPQAHRVQESAEPAVAAQRTGEAAAAAAAPAVVPPVAPRDVPPVPAAPATAVGGATLKEQVRTLLAADPTLRAAQIARQVGRDPSYTSKIVREVRTEMGIAAPA